MNFAEETSSSEIILTTYIPEVKSLILGKEIIVFPLNNKFLLKEMISFPVISNTSTRTSFGLCRLNR